MVRSLLRSNDGSFAAWFDRSVGRATVCCWFRSLVMNRSSASWTRSPSSTRCPLVRWRSMVISLSDSSWSPKMSKVWRTFLRCPDGSFVRTFVGSLTMVVACAGAAVARGAGSLVGAPALAWRAGKNAELPRSSFTTPDVSSFLLIEIPRGSASRRRGQPWPPG